MVRHKVNLVARSKDDMWLGTMPI